MYPAHKYVHTGYIYKYTYIQIYRYMYTNIYAYRYIGILYTNIYAYRYTSHICIYVV